MPKCAWHDQKKVNDFEAQTFLATCNPTYIDWEIVTLFYSALHYIDSFLDNAHGIDFIADHDRRNKLVNLLLPNLRKTYLSFYKLSQDARYDTTMGPPELVKALDYYEFIKHALTPITCPSCGQVNLNNKGKCEACFSEI